MEKLKPKRHKSVEFGTEFSQVSTFADLRLVCVDGGSETGIWPDMSTRIPGCFISERLGGVPNIQLQVELLARTQQ